MRKSRNKKVELMKSFDDYDLHPNLLRGVYGKSDPTQPLVIKDQPLSNKER